MTYAAMVLSFAAAFGFFGILCLFLVKSITEERNLRLKRGTHRLKKLDVRLLRGTDYLSGLRVSAIISLAASVGLFFLVLRAVSLSELGNIIGQP